MCVLIHVGTLHLNMDKDNKDKPFKIKKISRLILQQRDPVLTPQQALQLTPLLMITYRNSVPYKVPLSTAEMKIKYKKL